MDHDGRLVPGQGNPPGNCLMGHITSPSMGKDDLGPFMPSPATYLVQWGCENGYFWVKNSHWEKIVHTPQVSPEWPNHHQTPSLDMKQCYHACLTTLGPIRPSSGTPHDRGVFTLKNNHFGLLGEPRITEKGKMVRNITKHYLCIGPH